MRDNAYISLIIIVIGGIAQWLEQGAHNALVGGSSPSPPTSFARAKGAVLRN